MPYRSILLPCVLFALSILPACGDNLGPAESDGSVTDAGTDAGTDSAVDVDAGPAAPRVIATLPVLLGIEVPFDTVVTATFSKPMDAATITDVTFTLTQGVASIGGEVTFDAPSATATFTPDVDLEADRTYTGTITTGARDVGGQALAANHVWTFTTSDDVLPPVVTSTNPSMNAMNVSVNKRPTATFSKAMDPASLSDLTFTLRQGLTSIAGTVTLDGATNTATFHPSAALGVNLTYRATVTNGVRDTGGNAMLADHVWDFTTSACSQGPVVLGAAGAFAVLAGSTVTSTGPTSVTGDVGVSPGTAIIGFPPGILIGTRHAGNPTAAQAIADLTAAYNDAAGRSLCAVTVAGNLGGMTLTPGLYKSTSSLAISSGDLTLDAQGDGDAVFIFQMASTLTTTPGRAVILVNGAKAGNVFWQVGTSATLATTTAFQGTIMADQAVTLNTGATLNGRALARIAAASLSANTIVRPLP